MSSIPSTEDRSSKIGSWIKGLQYGQFEVNRVTYLSELQAEIRELTHLPTGARVIHISTDDQENVFSLSFQTIPETSNGIAHVLEHCVLCGSKKYPVRDPFFSMTRRSLNTFMNAFTGADFTCYPAATQNEKDFYNLLDVYIDAAFNPILSEISFAQEGHRLEFETMDDPSSPLTIKGVVYNEMKGSLSNPMRRLMEAVSETLFPDSPYGKNSGGDPKEIPLLTVEDLRRFHKQYYHPSRCLFFFYGNLPLEKHLDYIQEKALSQATSLEKIAHGEIKSQRRFEAPRTKKILYPLSKDEDTERSAYYSLSWLTCPITDQLETLALTILDIILMETDASLLKKELIASKLCRQASSSLDTESKEIPYVLVMSGLQEQDTPKIRELVLETLKKIAQEGISQEHIEMALHQVQFDRSEIGSDGTPFGVILYMRAALLAHHGSDPLWGLSIHTLFNELREKISGDTQFFSRIIHKYFLDNSHRAEIVMTPSSTLAVQEVEEEKKTLEKKKASLTQEEKEKIVSFAKELERVQNEEDDSSCLPTISLDDVGRGARSIHLNHEEALIKQEDKNMASAPINLYTHETFTNNISYLDITIPLPYIPFSDMWIARLLTVLLPQLGAGLRTYDQMLEEAQKKTGGISIALNMNCQAHSTDEFHPSWHLRGKALDHNLESLAGLLFDILTSPRLDEKQRIRDIIEKHYTNLSNAFSSSALRYASLANIRRLHKPGALQEAWYGLSYFKKIEDLVKNYSTREKELYSSLERVLKCMLSMAHGVDIIATAGSQSLTRMREEALWGLLDLPTSHYTPWNSSDFALPSHGSSAEIYLIPQQVSFTSLAFPGVPYDNSKAPYLTLASRIMDNTVLHKRIREQGGAYGTGAYLQTSLSNFEFYSYRDPHISSTIKAFYEAIDAIHQGDFDSEDLEEAKLEMIQGFDSPISPGSRGEVAYGWKKEGKTYELRSAFREKILDATKEDIQSALIHHFPSQEVLQAQARIAICTGKELYLNEKKELQESGLTLNEETIL